MEYNFREIEKNRQKIWKDQAIYKTSNDFSKPKYFVLDMFPYPSGAGLHVGHPLGYIASDIYSRYKRMDGFNVLHPMGYDAFGLPAEQYAIQTGQHPAVTTEANLKQYREQLDKIGFSFDWDREVKTCDPKYYKWTQWIFLKLFNHWYNASANKAEPIETLTALFEKDGFDINTATYINGTSGQDTSSFTATQWLQFTEEQKQEILLNFRIAFLSEAYVNWCPALGTVLANDEVKDGYSERGGHPVERKLMKQWSLRITNYADRLLTGLDSIEWSESIKDAQRNWIGKSKGSSVEFLLFNHAQTIQVFTTRPDTLFGVSFITLAPEHELIQSITADSQKNDMEAYVTYAKNRSERERQAEVKKITGCFTGSYAIHPFTGKQIPIWVGDYVLAGYGTGAVMGVPAHDSRDYAFAKHFELPIVEVVAGGDITVEAFEAKDGTLINSDFLNGLKVTDAINKMIEALEQKNIGKGKTNFRLRDAVFGRQRYWGEPIPIYYKNGIPYPMDEKELPLILPEIDKFLPTETGEPPLARAEGWNYETTTMPGWAGSSWYFLRYMDPQNSSDFASIDAINYWQQIDLYMGGSEHATGHLLYFRFWNKFLKDLGLVPCEEPAKKLVNQGMIQGMSAIIYRDNTNKNLFYGTKKDNAIELHVDVNFLNGDMLPLSKLQSWREEFQTAIFENNETELKCERAVEKMSKRWYNVVNPDDVVANYGADTLRLFEMFLGPLELSKPWNTQGIEGVHRFLKKLWKLFYNDKGEWLVTEEKATAAELKILHKTIKKITEDIENLSLNTSVSAFMICVNELQDINCYKREILNPLLLLISPFAPHISDELWALMKNEGSSITAAWPKYNQAYLIENSFNYPVSINGKHRTNIEFALDEETKNIEAKVLADETVVKWMEGKPLKKLVFVKGKIINIVI